VSSGLQVESAQAILRPLGTGILTEITGNLGGKDSQATVPEWGNQSTLGSGVDSERSQGGPTKGKESTSSDEDDELEEFLATGSTAAAMSYLCRFLCLLHARRDIPAKD
jgi:hypothetical protein